MNDTEKLNTEIEEQETSNEDRVCMINRIKGAIWDACAVLKLLEDKLWDASENTEEFQKFGTSGLYATHLILRSTIESLEKTIK